MREVADAMALADALDDGRQRGIVHMGNLREQMMLDLKVESPNSQLRKR